MILYYENDDELPEIRDNYSDTDSFRIKPYRALEPKTQTTQGAPPGHLAIYKEFNDWASLPCYFD